MSVEALISANYSTETSVVGDVRRALELKTAWYKALGIPLSEQPTGPLSFEPWLERAKHERLKNPALFSAFKADSRVQMITNLRERYSSEQNTTTFIMVNGKLRSELLPNEDFEVILERGLEYRRKTGSRELTREEKEVEGFKKRIQGVIYNSKTVVGTRIVVCSPPGTVEHTAYQKRFVDIWEVKQNLKEERYVQVTRFSAGLDYEGYRKAVLKLSPDYFDDQEADSLPLDAYFLSHPVVLPPQEQIGTVEALYEACFERDYLAMKEKLFQEIVQVCLPFINYFIEKLCEDKVNWVALAEAFNAVLNRADRFLEDREKRIHQPSLSSASYLPSFRMDHLPFDAQVVYFGRQEVRVVSAGCGASIGFNIRNRVTNLLQFFGNSVGKYGIESGGGICKECGGDKSDNHYHCPACPRKFADETNVAPENRTKQCGCGFKFGC